VSFISIIEKVKDIISSEIGDRRVHDKDVAHVLMLDETRLSKLKKADKIPYKELSLFAAKRKISINWLLFDQEPKLLEEETEKFARVRYLSGIRASAGGGAQNYEVHQNYIEVPLVLLHRAGIYFTKNIEAVTVFGDSMSPLIQSDGVAFIDRQKPFAQGSVCVVSSSEGCMLKRVYLQDGYVRLVSENKEYPDILLFDEEVRIEGVVVARGRL